MPLVPSESSFERREVKHAETASITRELVPCDLDDGPLDIVIARLQLGAEIVAAWEPGYRSAERLEVARDLSALRDFQRVCTATAALFDTSQTVSADDVVAAITELAPTRILYSQPDPMTALRKSLRLLFHAREERTLVVCRHFLAPAGSIDTQSAAAEFLETISGTPAVDTLLIEWLAREANAELLLGHARVPLVSDARLLSILQSGLCESSPTLRLVACMRCATDVSPVVAEPLLVAAMAVEPDETVQAWLRAAVAHVSSRPA